MDKLHIQFPQPHPPLQHITITEKKKKPDVDSAKEEGMGLGVVLVKMSAAVTWWCLPNLHYLACPYT